MQKPSLKPAVIVAVAALAGLGVALILAGAMLSSQVVWRPSFEGSSPGNVTIPGGDGYAFGGFGGFRGQMSTTRIIAAWFSSGSPTGGLQFEVLSQAGPGALFGILNSSQLDNAALLASSPASASGFGTADVTVSANVNGFFSVSPVLVNTSPTPVTLTDFGVAWEGPYYPNGQWGNGLEVGGVALVLLSAAVAGYAVLLPRRNAQTPPEGQGLVTRS